jgi:hypothetical protein
MPRLFSYTIPVDDGAAPNPFDGHCTLTICKPAIRRVATKDDWIAGLESKNAPSGDLSGRMVYAMRVDEVLSMAEYDRQAKSRWSFRIPDVNSKDLSRRLGDCIYDFSTDPPKQRPGVHNADNQPTDIGGMNALISTHFFYFGSKARQLPSHLQGILHQTQAHRSDANAPFMQPFIDWVDSLKLVPGQLYGWPDYIVNWGDVPRCGCRARKEDGENDKRC